VQGPAALWSPRTAREKAGSLRSPDVTAQARRLAAALEKAEVRATVFGARETTHVKLSADLGKPDDPATQELFKFLGPLVGKKL
jgi:hypothetical protein